MPASTAASAGSGGPCADCRFDRFPLEAVRSTALFDGPLRRAIHRLKYRSCRYAARSLAELLIAPTSTLDLQSARAGPALVLPVPLHPERERERGYNQAALLGQPLAEALNLPFHRHLLQRVKLTSPQVGLSRRQRRENLHNAFVAGAGLAGRSVLLVDDVTTTGSTLASAAQACLAAGARCVYAVTLAREA